MRSSLQLHRKHHVFSLTRGYFIHHYYHTFKKTFPPSSPSVNPPWLILPTTNQRGTVRSSLSLLSRTQRQIWTQRQKTWTRCFSVEAEAAKTLSVVKKKSSKIKKFMIALSSLIVLRWIYLFSSFQERPQSWQIFLLRTLPLRFLSYIWGVVHNKELYRPLRVPLYKLWGRVFGANLEEAGAPLESYPNLATFFARSLKEGARPIDPSADMVSPVDGRVVITGEVVEGKLEQIKGVEYSIKDFLGYDPSINPAHRLFYAVFYLAPGDYHRIHSPVDSIIHQSTHFSGELFSVHPWVVRYVPSLFVLNERVVLTGEWKSGYYSLSPVAAFNVGSIKINFEPALATNKLGQKINYKLTTSYRESAESLKTSTPYVRDSRGLTAPKGEELGRFELGSTVVLLFEAPSTFTFTIKPNELVRVGQKIHQ